MILFGEDALRKAVREFTAHYHLERNHKGSATDSSCRIRHMWEPLVKSGGASDSVDCSTTIFVSPRRVEVRDGI